jgi:hypothetical protein
MLAPLGPPATLETQADHRLRGCAFPARAHPCPLLERCQAGGQFRGGPRHLSRRPPSRICPRHVCHSAAPDPSPALVGLPHPRAFLEASRRRTYTCAARPRCILTRSGHFSEPEITCVRTGGVRRCLARTLDHTRRRRRARPHCGPGGPRGSHVRSADQHRLSVLLRWDGRRGRSRRMMDDLTSLQSCQTGQRRIRKVL